MVPLKQGDRKWKGANSPVSSMPCADDVLLSCTLQPCMVLETNVTLINWVKGILPFFVLLKSSTDWLMLTHTGLGNLLSQLNQMLVSFRNTLTYTRMCKHTKNFDYATKVTTYGLSKPILCISPVLTDYLPQFFSQFKWIQIHIGIYQNSSSCRCTLISILNGSVTSSMWCSSWHFRLIIRTFIMGFPDLRDVHPIFWYILLSPNHVLLLPIGKGMSVLSQYLPLIKLSNSY